MVKDQTEKARDVWEQWDWIWYSTAGIFWLLNMILGLRNLIEHGSKLLFVVLSMLIVVWYIPFIGWPAEHWRNRRIISILYFLIGWILLGWLIGLSNRSLLLVALFYPMIFTRFPIQLAILVAFLQTAYVAILFVTLSEMQYGGIVTLIAMGGFMASTLIAGFISKLIAQSIERKNLIEELAETRASLLNAEREAGILTERQRVSREFHDSIAQHFTSVIMQLNAARLGDSKESINHIGRAEQSARDGLEETRRIIQDMQPRILEESSLIESIEHLADGLTRDKDINVNTMVTGEVVPLDPDKEKALLRIVQEALQNIGKHARANSVTITISFMADNLTLDIADDGVGFISDRVHAGYGLNNIMERTQEMEGKFDLESAPGQGTKIAVSIPISRIDANEHTHIDR
ncbi:MAG: sensor histidine kinase [Anaerolineales bacterium]|nr:sensor histidine kinase [Anaerolineales bacterium]